MPTISNFPNGTTLISSANTPDTIANIFQVLIANVLGIDPKADPDKAFSAVRVAWLKEGQPAFSPDDNVCIIKVTVDDDPYSRVRDNIDGVNTLDPTTNTQNMAFTQVWDVHPVFYGPTSYDNARLLLSAMSLDWVHDYLSDLNLYGVVKYHRPVYLPEVFARRWYKRADLSLKINELVNESTTVATALGVDVTILTDTGITRAFHIGS